MAKGDDSVMRKRNKKLRKRMNSKSDSTSVSAKIAAVIASKKRRKAGKRRVSEGMCFSLPTIDDPFNDRHGKPESKTKDAEKKTPSRKEKTFPVKGKSAHSDKGEVGGSTSHKPNQKLGNNYVTDNNKIDDDDDEDLCCGQEHDKEIKDFPSNFVFWCLNAIENALRRYDAYTEGEGNSFFHNEWGLEFFKCFSTNKNLLDTGGSFATNEQIAWMVSAAADNFVRKEKHGLSLDTPFLLFLVPSEKKAGQVRTVCKPLKSLGIHTVSVHPGASIEHQIQGLKSCEPEFLISTPERLMELVSMKAIDISSVSMLVIDGLNAICNAGHGDAIKSIRKFISGNPSLVIFNDSFKHTSIPVIQHLLTGPICRISIDNSIASLSSCIVQSVQVCASDEDIHVKSIEVLCQFWSSQTHNSNLLYILRKDVKCPKLVKTLKSMGCSTSLVSEAVTISDSVDSNRRLVTMIVLEDISTADIGMYDVIVLPSFVPSMETYEHILTNMARRSVKGVLHGFLTKRDAELAGPLISMLEQCEQEVPETLQDLHRAPNVLED